MSPPDAAPPTAARAPATTAPAPARHDDTGMRLALLATMAVWGGNLSMVKALLGHFDPMVLSLLRMASAAAVLLLVLRWQRPAGVPPLRERMTPRLALGVAACGTLMVYLNQIGFTWGVRGTQAANAALIIALNPLVSTLGAAVLFGERLTLRRLAGVVLGFGGVAAVVLHRPGMALGGPGAGDLLVFFSVVSWVGGGLLVQRLARRLDTATISTLATCVGTLLLVVHVAFDPGAHWPDTAALPAWVWPTLVASGVAATAIGSLVWNRGLQRLGIARASLFAYWVPIFGVGFAVLALGEPFSAWHAIGLAAVLGGTWLGTH